MRNEMKMIRKRIEEINGKLQGIKEKVEEYLDTAENQEYLNDERIEKLQNEIDCIERAHDQLDSILETIDEIE